MIGDQDWKQAQLRSDLKQLFNVNRCRLDPVGSAANITRMFEALLDRFDEIQEKFNCHQHVHGGWNSTSSPVDYKNDRLAIGETLDGLVP